ncbi:TOBE domain-containing protein [Campylobacter sp. RM12327]|uniref:TOBE domain-containing protein n=1 Tax=Campylobacter sputorum TaxID=206 RepID=UPI0013747F1F|nr:MULTISPECIES: TOBE domain-containing protein [Campylobacter]ASM39610.1 putative molybdopterin binding protein [Campylobacter sputorum]MBE7358310.1 TOBE domain-containing protein [Campylobacter sp. RM11302]MBF6669472.1 TOBE domain-containing protein [Campylobacter sp. RM12327]MBF6674785.1 TOBE domain-containing protein [Campylobacter sp. RM13538]MBF6676607.1 TOBE domain-containing protein [Campylobacter sp. RM12321]
MDTNKIYSRVVSIKTNGSLNLINLSSDVGDLAFVSLDILLSLNDKVVVGFKSSAVAICKTKRDDLSYLNQIEVEISSIEKGEILTKIVGCKNGIFISSLITTNSTNRLNLQVGENVVFLIKSTDMFLV